MTKSASKHITAVPEERAGPVGITPQPGHPPKHAQTPPEVAAPAVPLGSRVAAWALVAGLGVLALQLLAEPLHWLLHRVGVFR
jgi:hypothetical protein